MRSNVTTAQKFCTKAELIDLLPEGFQLLDFDFGDLDGDGDKDCLAAYRLIDEDEYSSELALRPVIVYLRGAGEQLIEFSRNDNALYCYDCGGCIGDPFIGISIENCEFQISHLNGCWFRTSLQTTFAYDSLISQFVLIEHKTVSGNVISEDDSPIHLKEEVIRYNRKITFESYDINVEMNR